MFFDSWCLTTQIKIICVHKCNFYYITVYYLNYLLIKHVYTSLFLLFSIRCCLQLLYSDLCNSSVLISCLVLFAHIFPLIGDAALSHAITHDPSIYVYDTILSLISLSFELHSELLQISSNDAVNGTIY